MFVHEAFSFDIKMYIQWRLIWVNSVVSNTKTIFGRLKRIKDKGKNIRNKLLDNKKRILIYRPLLLLNAIAVCNGGVRFNPYESDDLYYYT